MSNNTDVIRNALFKLGGRKFLLAIIGCLAASSEAYGVSLPKETIMSVAGIVSVYILGEALVDAKK